MSFILLIEYSVSFARRNEPGTVSKKIWIQEVTGNGYKRGGNGGKNSFSSGARYGKLVPFKV
jgi:hypothetical protein